MPAVKAAQIDELMERASEALQQTRYFEAERMAMKALAMARGINDFDRLARIALPLQEARRQRMQAAIDTDQIHILDQPFGEDAVHAAGCYLVRPPLVGADARRLRLKAIERDVPVIVVCREPTTDLKLIPIVAIGRFTLRTKVRPADKNESVTMEWFLSALEALGDTALDEIDPGLTPERRVDALLDRLDTLPEHEKLHQALAEAAKIASRALDEVANNA